jgi:heme-degrading monooxygenase HmoA
MIETVWTYRVKAKKTVEFERRYAADGDWAQLFRRAAGYQGTTLYKDIQTPGRYSTVDRWEELAALKAFKVQCAGEYESLDRLCSELTESEEHVGIFEALR